MAGLLGNQAGAKGTLTPHLTFTYPLFWGDFMGFKTLQGLLGQRFCIFFAHSHIYLRPVTNLSFNKRHFQFF